MELIKSTDNQYDEYESLLLERDQVRKDTGSIWIGYIKAFGQLISDGYKEKLECIKCKKTISYYQAALNHGSIVDPEAMQNYLDQEMAAYYANLKRMQEDNERCKKAGTSTAYEVQRAKTLYRRLAKLLHPDINPETDRHEALMELWQRVVSAYGRNDVKELSELEILVRKARKELGAGEVRVDIPDIYERIASLKEEIYEITHTEPYIYKDLLDDPEQVEKKKKELSDELEEYRKYHQELDKVIKDMLQSGGIKLKWRMN